MGSASVNMGGLEWTEQEKCREMEGRGSVKRNSIGLITWDERSSAVVQLEVPTFMDDRPYLYSNHMNIVYVTFTI